MYFKRVFPLSLQFKMAGVSCYDDDKPNSHYAKRGKNSDLENMVVDVNRVNWSDFGNSDPRVGYLRRYLTILSLSIFELVYA